MTNRELNSQKRVSQWMIYISIALFVVEKISVFVKTQEITASQFLISIALLLIMVALILHLEYIHINIHKIHEEITSIKSEMRDIGIENGHIQKINALFENSKKSKKIHIEAGMEVLREIARVNSEENLQDFIRFDKNHAERATLRDISSAFLLLEKVEEKLPLGGAWIGITHLTDPKVWDHTKGKETFNNYVIHLHDRTAKAQILGFRLFCLPDEESYHRMKPTLKKEREAGVVVKYYISPKPPTDMSLIWHLENHVGKAKNMHFNVKEGIEECRNLVELMRVNSLIPVCALEFTTQDWQFLEQVIIHRHDTIRFNGLCNEFLKYWKMAKFYTD